MLKGKVILVTGGAQRVGREIVLALAAEGADVVIHYNRSESEAKQLADEIGTKFKQIPLLVQADLTRPDEVRKIVPLILKEKGGIFAIINNASVYSEKILELVSEQEWDTNFSVHAKAPFLLAQAARMSMRKGGGGKIINIADWAGMTPYRDYLPYCVSKGALITLTKVLAVELAPEVQVNCICPGPVLRPVDLSEAQMATELKDLPSRKMGNPQDIVQAVRYFLQTSSFVTGSVLTVDGGRSLGR